MEEKDFILMLEEEIKFTRLEEETLKVLGSNSEVVDKLFSKVLNKLKNKMLAETLSVEWVRGAKVSIDGLSKLIRSHK